MTMNSSNHSVVSFDIQEIAVDDGGDALSFADVEMSSPTTSDKAKEPYDRESQRVRFAGRALLIYLVLLGFLGATWTARSLHEREEDDYEAAFTSAASALSEALRQDAEHMLSAMDWFSQIIVSHSRDFNMDWPLVTLSDMEAQASRLHQLVGTEQLFLLPLVKQEDRTTWEDYSVAHFPVWVDQSLSYGTTGVSNTMTGDSISPYMQTVEGARVNEESDGPFLPVWQTAPVMTTLPAVYNTDLLSDPVLAPSLRAVLTSLRPVWSPILQERSLLLSASVQVQSSARSSLLYPVLDPEENLLAILVATFGWRSKVKEHLASGIDADLVTTRVESSCNEETIFVAAEREWTAVQSADPDDLSVLSSLVLSELPGMTTDPSCSLLLKFQPSRGSPDLYETALPLRMAFFCLALLGIAVVLWYYYATVVAHRQALVARQAGKSSALVSSLFPDTIRDRLMLQASQANLDHGTFTDDEEEDDLDKEDRVSFSKTRTNETSDSSNSERAMTQREPPKMRLRSFLREANRAGPSSTRVLTSEAKPIADFFPNCTVLFADIVGFTAWSSQREPDAVFTLLQSLYSVFDRSAKKLGVFKVETIGDSYVAVTGLPDPQSNHAVIMAKFAMECKSKMKDVTKKLVKLLGPETEDLRMRFGLHSGPVTAGVLRGERSRFQLFGDTVNTAARMESCGEANRIQISEATAALLVAGGMGNMVTPRDELIEAKGKGTMRVYWLEENTGRPGNRRTSLSSTMHSSVISFGMFSSAGTFNMDKSTDDLSFAIPAASVRSGISRISSFSSKMTPPERRLESRPSLMWGASNDMLEPKLTKFRRNSSSSTQRLIDWNCHLLLRLLKQVVSKRKRKSVNLGPAFFPETEDVALRDAEKTESTLVDEVAEIISMPGFEPEDPNLPETEAVLPLTVENQLRDFVNAIASMYRENPFHNYEHACHVQMSMSKLLERVVNPDDIDYDGESAAIASHVHNYTYGITSDPLTQFAVVFCALIHDVDHTGVSNGQLIKENAHIATLYKNKSVAEQNSIDLTWDLLMSEEYSALRSCIYTDEMEFKRFRQLVVNTVLATDIFDKELSALRKNRWTKAFKEVSLAESSTDAANRKATIVIEHLIQASDVSHTMQHWEIYLKWNERLFHEMYLSYQSGRTEADPSQGWYKGELWFFDNYVIPLAKKLDECGVFGVCSDECLTYAMENRKLWEIHGEQIVTGMLATDYSKKQKEEEQNRRPRRRHENKARGLDTNALHND